jgi:methyl-accepting chemotaxis protein
MVDDRSNRGPQDRSRISLTEDDEVGQWTQHFGASKDRLAEAVGAVGPSAAKVEENHPSASR